MNCGANDNCGAVDQERLQADRQQQAERLRYQHFKGRVLVTGHAGYIGQTVCNRLRYLGIPYIGMDSKTGSDVFFPAHVQLAFQTCPDITAVIHLAAVSSVDQCEADPELALANNLIGTNSLLSVLSAQRKPPRVVFASSQAVKAQPISGVYAATKKLAERELSHYFTATSAPCFALRIANVAGGNHESRTHLIPNLVRSIAYPPFDLTADPEKTVRDFVHVEDVAEAFIHFATIDVGPSFHYLDICSGQPYSIYDLMGLVYRRWGRTIQYNRKPDRKGDFARIPDNNPVHARRLGWSPTLGIERILEDAKNALDKNDTYRRAYGG